MLCGPLTEIRVYDAAAGCTAVRVVWRSMLRDGGGGGGVQHNTSGVLGAKRKHNLFYTW